MSETGLLFPAFDAKRDHFTKTGSGQTNMGKTQEKPTVFFSGEVVEALEARGHIANVKAHW